MSKEIETVPQSTQSGTEQPERKRHRLAALAVVGLGITYAVAPDVLPMCAADDAMVVSLCLYFAYLLFSGDTEKIPLLAKNLVRRLGSRNSTPLPPQNRENL